MSLDYINIVFLCNSVGKEKSLAEMSCIKLSLIICVNFYKKQNVKLAKLFIFHKE